MHYLTQWIIAIGGLVTAACLAGCASAAKSPANHSATISKEPFGTADGVPVDIYRLRNAHGVEARICNYGGIVVSLKVPDKSGQFADVVLGYDTLDG